MCFWNNIDFKNGVFLEDTQVSISPMLSNTAKYAFVCEIAEALYLVCFHALLALVPAKLFRTLGQCVATYACVMSSRLSFYEMACFYGTKIAH